MLGGHWLFSFKRGRTRREAHLEASEDHINTLRDEVHAVVTWWGEFQDKKFSADDLAPHFQPQELQNSLDAYLTALRQNVDQALLPIQVGSPLYQHQTAMFDDAALEAIRLWKDDFVFTQVDMLAAAFAVICKVKVAEAIINDLENSPTYTLVADSEEDICFTL